MPIGLAETKVGLTVIQQAVGAWDKFELSADEFIEQGDTVVVLGHTDLAKGERSERLPVVHIWRLSRRRGDLPSADPHRHTRERTDPRHRLNPSGDAEERGLPLVAEAGL
jgi:hypothetical protein